MTGTRVPGRLAALVALLGGCGNSSKPRAVATTRPAPTTIAATTTTVAPTTYQVQRGDTLSGIAQKLHVAAANLAAANNITDPDKIKAGDVLKVPAPGAATSSSSSSSSTTPTTTTRP